MNPDPDPDPSPNHDHDPDPDPNLNSNPKPNHHDNPKLQLTLTLTDNDVGGEGDPRDGAADALHQAVVRGPRVSAAHAGQHRAGAALRRHVQLPADVLPRRDDLQIVRRCMNNSHGMHAERA